MLQHVIFKIYLLYNISIDITNGILKLKNITLKFISNVLETQTENIWQKNLIENLKGIYATIIGQCIEYFLK